MKRKGNLYHRIATHENLCIAFAKAARGKQDHPEVIAFRQDFDVNIRKLGDQLLTHRPDVGHYRFFQVCDPKLRQICAASFPERVLHHAMMNICEPILESYSISDSYACRKNKGNRKALLKATEYAQKYDWYLKADIRKYFDSIDHNILMTLLSRRFKDKEVLELFQRVFNTYHTEHGKGVPIGNLLSQHSANFYLGCLDHWVKERRGIRGYVRYMDDFILFAHNKDVLKTELGLIKEFLEKNLALQLKDNVQLNRCCRGIPFLGFRVYPHQIRLSPRSKQRFIIKFREYEKKYVQGHWTEKELIAHIEPLIGFVKIANSSDFRRSVIQRFGVLS
ncbi:MAG: hypothetical protein BWK80_39385 [Desulfobacteraceae bacterium IS3]|nr:MAG: hypothetical protein BWK80_39385 [Desulfobacteraceae bacterium IS3]